MDTKELLEVYLKSVPDSYDDFVLGIQNLLKTDEQKQNMINCLRSNPTISTSTIIEHLHEFKPDFPAPCEPIEPLIYDSNGKHKCPVCEKYIFEEEGSYDICEICGWEDDPLQAKNHNYKGGANHMSVNEAKEAYKEHKTVY